MKTAMDLPAELMRTIKLRAVRENRKLNDLIAELLWRGLEGSRGQPPLAGHRVDLPLVRCAHAADPDEEMTPERVATVLSDEETRGAIA